MNQQEQTSYSFFKEMKAYMQPYKRNYALSILISICGVAAHLSTYYFVGKIAAFLFTQQYDAIFAYAAYAILAKLLYGLCLNLSTWISHKAAYQTLADIRSALTSKMLKLPQGYFELHGSGRLKTLLTDEIENIEVPLAHVLPELSANLLIPFLLIVWFFLLDWRLALVMLIWIILGFSVTGGMMKNYPEKFAGQIKAHKTMTQTIMEYVKGIEVIKNFGQSDRCCSKYDQAVLAHANYNINWQKETLRYTALGMAIAPFSLFPVLIAGIYFFAHQTLDAPSFVLAILLTMGIFQPLMQTMGYFDQLASMGTLAKEINDVLTYQEVTRGSGETCKDASITFKDVSFSYTKDTPVLHHLNFHIPKHTMLALVGPSGSGKSSIAKLLAGYWDTSEGTIYLDQAPLTSYTQEQLNELIAFVDQDTFLFDTSIADNIRLYKPQASDEEVIRISQLAGCDDFIKALPDGYQTRAGSAGCNLSGGEKQRIAIARAMMKDAPILILDEATASADPENEALIQKALSAAAIDKTLIVVAHHLSTITHADQIAYLEHGEIKAIDTHENLLTTCPGYQHLWQLNQEV